MPQNIKDDKKVSLVGEAGRENWFDKEEVLYGEGSVDEASVASAGVSGAEGDQNTQIGARIRNVRLLLGFTQSAFSSLMNVTFQQVQKYERGLNRISAVALWKLSQKLGVSISFFFPNHTDGKKDGSARASVSEKAGFFNFDDGDASATGYGGHLKEINSLLAQFRRLKSPKVRRRVVSLVQTIAESEQERSSKKGVVRPSDGVGDDSSGPK